MQSTLITAAPLRGLARAAFLGALVSSLLAVAAPLDSPGAPRETSPIDPPSGEADQALLQTHESRLSREEGASRSHDSAVREEAEASSLGQLRTDHRAEASTAASSASSLASVLACFGVVVLAAIVIGCSMQRRSETKALRRPPPIQWTQQSLLAVPAKSLANLPSRDTLSTGYSSTGCSGPSWNSAGSSPTSPEWARTPGTYGTLAWSEQGLASHASLGAATAPASLRSLPSWTSLEPRAWEPTRL